MKRRQQTKKWLNRHINDEFVRRAQLDGYRSRASYKLLEIADRDKLLRTGQTVIDLGAAPGGWSQVARQRVGAKGRVIALDILPINHIENVEIIQGDFTTQDTLQALLAQLNGQSVDIVISDMSPNITGEKAVDQPRSVYFAELALELARQVLKPQGDLLLKIFQGYGFDEFKKELTESFQKVITRKPKASRDASREVYLLARQFHL